MDEEMRAYINELEPYEPRPSEGVARRLGVRPDQIIRLDYNENPYGPSPAVLQALARYRGYGDYPEYETLTKRLAQYAGVAPENLVLGNGGDEVIDLAVRVSLAPGQKAIIPSPAFGMYSISVKAHRGEVLDVPRRADLSLDLERIEEVARSGTGEARPRVLFLTSPGNPDAKVIPIEVVRRLVSLPLTVILDEAYIEFGGESSVPLLDECDNLIILRTFSKWAGMAGLRLGYAITTPELADAVARLVSPFRVNAAAVVAALATFDDLPRVQARIARLIEERERLREALAELPGLCPLPSKTNFILCRVEGWTGEDLAEALVRQGIVVRTFSHPLLADTIRITVGQPEQHEALLVALRSLLDPDIPPFDRLALLSAAPGRRAEVERHTSETDISISLALDGKGSYQVDTGLGFLDHMLAQLAAHGLFDLAVRALGDLDVDAHHTVEDVAIGLGQALDRALGGREGIVRMGEAFAPLDEALAHVVVDLSGRPYAVLDADLGTPKLGSVDTDLILHFMETLAVHARMSLHARILYGRNGHHKAEALFKALGRALDAASRQDSRRQGVPSTKGVL
jgi:histidinol-phosphate aminotransferase